MTDYTLGALNERGEFDVFARVRDDGPAHRLIALIPLGQESLKEAIDSLLSDGLLAYVNGRYTITEKGRQLQHEFEEELQRELIELQGGQAWQ